MREGDGVRWRTRPAGSDVAIGTLLPALLTPVSAACRQRRHAAAASCSAASRAATAEPRGALVAARSKPQPVNRACFVLPCQALALASPALACSALRSFAAGTYLDKAQVTDRVLNVVKNFAKVDPAKARLTCAAEQAGALTLKRFLAGQAQQRLPVGAGSGQPGHG